MQGNAATHANGSVFGVGACTGLMPDHGGGRDDHGWCYAYSSIIYSWQLRRVLDVPRRVG